MTQVLKILFLDLVWDIVYFPIWWYTRGFAGTARWVGVRITNLSRNLGLAIWIKNLFRPMYGQHDAAGQIISFFVRLFQIGFRSILLLVGTLWYFVLLGVWVVVPVAVISELF